jgi:hypothetical protein
LKAAKNPEKKPLLGLEHLLPDEEQELHMKEILKLYRDGYYWEPARIGSIAYNTAPAFDKCKKFHVICVLGQGGTGRTLLCCSSNGRAFAEKLFLVSEAVNQVYFNRPRRRRHGEAWGNAS